MSLARSAASCWAYAALTSSRTTRSVACRRCRAPSSSAVAAVMLPWFRFRTGSTIDTPTVTMLKVSMIGRSRPAESNPFTSNPVSCRWYWPKRLASTPPSARSFSTRAAPGAVLQAPRGGAPRRATGALPLLDGEPAGGHRHSRVLPAPEVQRPREPDHLHVVGPGGVLGAAEFEHRVRPEAGLPEPTLR